MTARWEHDFQRTIPTDGMWCQRCGLAEARWAGELCPGVITPEAFESAIVRARHGDAEAIVYDLAAADSLLKIAAIQKRAREWVAQHPRTPEEGSTQIR